MRPLRLLWLWQMIGAVMLIVVLVASLIPPPQIMQTVSDKLLHTITYLVLAAWYGSIYLRRRHWLVWTALVLFGIGIEFLQRQTGYRSFEVNDMVADAIGAGIGIVMIQTPLGNALQWVERRLERA